MVESTQQLALQVVAGAFEALDLFIEDAERCTGQGFVDARVEHHEAGKRSLVTVLATRL